MKIIIVSLFALSLPSLLFAQQEPSKSSNGQVPSCALSKWSTTGAACDYAPDLLTTTKLVPPGFDNPADITGSPLTQPESLPGVQKTQPLQNSTIHKSKPKLKLKQQTEIHWRKPGIAPIGNPNPDHMPVVKGDSLMKGKQKKF